MGTKTAWCSHESNSSLNDESILKIIFLRCFKRTGNALY